MKSQYLPDKDELKPITGKSTTFFDCQFNQDFDLLDFKQKLQVATDIVRQSMKGVQFPNPNTEKETLYGNCHTSALVLIDYLKELGIGKNHKYVMCRKRPYDPEDITSRHAAVFVDDDNGETYFVDPTAFVGFKYGTVQKLSDKDIAYEEYEVLDDEKFELIFHIRDFLYKASSNTLNKNEIPFYLDVINTSLDYPILDGYNSHCWYYMGTLIKDKVKADKCFETAKKINPYFHLLTTDLNKSAQRKALILDQIKKWKEELQDLQSSNSSDYKRQLELATNIFQEMKFIDNSLDTKMPFEGKLRSISHMTPRMMLDNGFNVAMIKSSAYHIGVDSKIREELLKKSAPVFEYTTNLCAPRPITGLIPLIYSHPCGKENLRPYQGQSNIMLLKRPTQELYALKKQLRETLGGPFYGKELIWNDGEKILWHPFSTNLVHTTDSPSETALHLLNGFPEQQLMTRFMYPNPRLAKLDEQNIK